MKKPIAAILSLLLIISMMTSTAVFAQETTEAQQVIDIDRVDADTVPDTENYTIVDDGEPLLEVVHVKEPGATAALNDGVTNGYYTAEFMIPESSYQVYLTGLTQDNVSEIRQAIIESYTEDGDFDLKNLGFIDAEKTWENDGDEYMCWAASTANILTYTGWAAQAGFDSSDDLFEAFINNFTDDSGNVECATGWFVNGISAPEGAQPTPGTGRYLPQYNYSDLVDAFDTYNNCVEQFRTVYPRLKAGYGVSLSLDIYGNNGYEGGHSVTLWGFVTDRRYPETSAQYYHSVFITDSDSDKNSVKNGKDRRDADDVMSLYTLERQVQEGIDTFSFDISYQKIGLIAEAVTVAPYSADIPYETSPEATLDPVNYPDIVLDPFILSDDPNDDEKTITTFADGTTVYYHPYMMNVANADYVGKLYLVVTVKNAQGTEVYSRTFHYSQPVTISHNHAMGFTPQSITAKLSVGDYTITASFNPDHDVTEAYYFNNTRSIDFKVRGKYLLGDADNDGSVDITDATKIQRILAYLETAENDLTQRGDVNESGDLDILDATQIQRYLAHMAILYPIDVERFYE